MRHRNDRERLRAVFSDFRAMGYWSREAQPDGWNAVPEDRIRTAGKVVFWHYNEKGCFDDEGNLCAPLHLRHFVKDTDEVAIVLGRHGIKYRVDNSDNGGVVILP